MTEIIQNGDESRIEVAYPDYNENTVDAIRAMAYPVHMTVNIRQKHWVNVYQKFTDEELLSEYKFQVNELIWLNVAGLDAHEFEVCEELSNYLDVEGEPTLKDVDEAIHDCLPHVALLMEEMEKRVISATAVGDVARAEKLNIWLIDDLGQGYLNHARRTNLNEAVNNGDA